MKVPKLLRAPSRRGLAFASAVLALGLTGGFGVASTLAADERSAAHDALRLRTTGVRAALDATFQRYADTMHDLASTAATLTPAQVPQTVAAIVGERLPGAHEILVLGPDQTVVAEHAVDGSTPPPRRDLAREPDVQRVLAAARQSGRLTAATTPTLPRDRTLPAPHRQQSILLAVALHPAGAEFRGWVLASVRAGDLLGRTLSAAGVGGVTASLLDEATGEIAHWGTEPSAGGYTDAAEILFAERSWRVVVEPTDALVAGPRASADTVAFGICALAGLLLAGLVLTAVSSRDRAVAAAADAAAARRADAARAKRAEAALRAREAELSAFATITGERLQVPLGNVAGFTDLLREAAGPHLDEASRGFLDRIGRTTERMLSLVEELLAYATTGEAALRLEPVDTTRLIGEVIGERYAHLPNRPSIDVGHLPVVTADANLLRQVFDQLIGNAVRFVRHGATARVTIRAEQDANGWWRIEIADRGIGIPAEHRTGVFAPFHRTPSAEGFPGSGLGLAVCERIVSLHGGQIGAEANPGGGTVVWFTIFDGRSGSQSGEHPSFSAHHA